MSDHQIFVEVNGVSKTPQDWADFLGVSVSSFFMRLQDGRNVDDKLFGNTASTTIPKVENKVRNGRKAYTLTLRGETKSLQEWCKEIGIGMTSLRYRLEKGYTEEQILQPRQATNSKELPILQKGVKKSSLEQKPQANKVPGSSPSSSVFKKEKPKKEVVAKTEKPKHKNKVETVTLLGTELPVKEWADTLGITVKALEFRISQGWSEQELLYGKKYNVPEPIVTKNPEKFVLPETKRDSKLDQEVCYEGEIKTLREWSVDLGVSQNVIRNRMNSGKKGRELLLPVKEIESRVEIRIGNRKLSFRQWAELSGVPEDVIRSRFNKGIRGNQLLFLDPKFKKKQA